VTSAKTGSRTPPFVVAAEVIATTFLPLIVFGIVIFPFVFTASLIETPVNV
jgi:hypothetical protein